MKIQNKIIYILLSLFMVYTLLFSGFIYYSISGYTFSDFYKRLEIRAITTVKSQVEQMDYGMVIGELRQEYLEELQNEQVRIIELTNKDDLKKMEVPNGVNRNFIEEIISDGTSVYSKDDTHFYGTVYTSTAGITYLVIASAENYFMSHHMSFFRNLLFTSVIIAFLITVITSFLFSRNIYQPINDIIEKVKDISSENLHLRLEPGSRQEQDAIVMLTNTFNDMLNRLETSFETQKNFISNASHELNTPLTSIRGMAEVTLSKLRSSHEYVESLQLILQNADILEKKTKALLFLAQTGYDGKKQNFKRIRIDQLLMDVKETIEKLDNNNKVELDFNFLPTNPDRLKVYVNEQLLHLALSNVIQNGCKYSNQRVVKIGLGVTEDKVIILVEDDGIGIPPEEIGFIYDPYFRASNTDGHEGYGIGLPLARNIIKIHKGQLLVTSVVNSGTTVRIELPNNHI